MMNQMFTYTVRCACGWTGTNRDLSSSDGRFGCPKCTGMNGLSDGPKATQEFEASLRGQDPKGPDAVH